VTAYSDDELLDELARLIGATPAEPRESDILRLRAAVAGRDSWPGLLPASRERWSRWLVGRVSWRRRFALAGLGLTAALASSSTAWALGGAPLPGPVRTLAVAVGLPVDGPEVAAAKRAVGQLAEALEDRRIASLAPLVDSVHARVAALSSGDRRDIEPRATRLIAEASEEQGAGPNHQASASGEEERGERSGSQAPAASGEKGKAEGHEHKSSSESATSSSTSSSTSSTTSSSTTSTSTTEKPENDRGAPQSTPSDHGDRD